MGYETLQPMRPDRGIILGNPDQGLIRQVLTLEPMMMRDPEILLKKPDQGLVRALLVVTYLRKLYLNQMKAYTMLDPL